MKLYDDGNEIIRLGNHSAEVIPQGAAYTDRRFINNTGERLLQFYHNGTSVGILRLSEIKRGAPLHLGLGEVATGISPVAVDMLLDKLGVK